MTTNNMPPARSADAGPYPALKGYIVTGLWDEDLDRANEEKRQGDNGLTFFEDRRSAEAHMEHLRAMFPKPHLLEVFEGVPDWLRTAPEDS